MRLLVIGFPLPNVDIDNYSVLTAPSYSDYDAVCVDPASITRSVRELVEDGREFEAFDGRPVLNAPTSASAVSGADQVRRRAEETRRLLDTGGTVIVFGRPDATQNGLQGFEGCDRYSWLPAPAGLSWGPPYLRAAEGKTVRIVAEDHPTAGLLREARSAIGYRATFDDRQPEVRRAGRVIATGGSGLPIAMEFALGPGRIVFLPALNDDATSGRADFAQGLVDAARRLDAHAEPGSAPYWVRSLPVPGLEQVEAELEEAETAAVEASAHAAAVRERHDDLARHRRLLWEDGAPVVQAVADAFRMLGFAVTGGAGEPLQMASEGNTAFLEVESSREQVVEWPYVRLQRRLEANMLSGGGERKGVVVANGFRDIEPSARVAPLSTPLELACQNYHYALLSGETLFALVQRVLGGADEATLTAARRRIMSGAGLLTTEAALGEVGEGTPDHGPIF
jgi:hypothetical protein